MADIDEVRKDLKPAAFTGAATAVMGTVGGLMPAAVHSVLVGGSLLSFAGMLTSDIAVVAAYVPEEGGWLNGDFAYSLPHMLSTAYARSEQGPFALLWFTPSFCGGLPALANARPRRYRRWTPSRPLVESISSSRPRRPRRSSATARLTGSGIIRQKRRACWRERHG